MASARTTFPVGETIGFFIGIVAWDLLTEGRIEIVKALLITAPCSLAWYGICYWVARVRSNKH